MTTCSISLPSTRLEVGAPSDRSLMVLLIGLCVFSAALGRFCFLLRPFDNDAAIFIYMGRMVCQGGRLCHDLFDNKFPTVGLMISPIYRCLGTCWPAYIALQAAASTATALALGRSAARTAGPHARLPTALFAIVFLNITIAVFGGFQLETLQILFTALAASAGIELIRSHKPADGFTAGLCAGCGMMFKPTAAGVLLAIAIGLMVQRPAKITQWIRIGIAMLAGLCIPLAVALIYLIDADILRDMPGLYRQISTYASQTVFDAVELIKPLAALLLLGFPLLIRGLIFRRQRDDEMRSVPAAVLTMLITWLVIETAGVILQRRMYAYHFLPMIPPAALLFGMLPRTNKPGSLAAALLPIMLLSISQACHLIAATTPSEDRLALSSYLSTHAKSTDAVWMDAWPRLVLETGLRPGARLPFTFLFTNYDDAGLDYSATLLADFDRIKPQYIILPMPLDRRLQNQIDFIPELNQRPRRRESYLTGWHRILQYAQDHYNRETMVGNNAVYLRKPA